MSEHTVDLSWSRGDGEFTYDAYSRDHRLHFDGGAVVEASAGAAYRGNPAGIDPEEAFVGALSSCYLLNFLAVAAKAGAVVDSYEDAAVGVLGKDADGNIAITRVTLRPRIVFSGTPPDEAELARMHQVARRDWYIGNSVRATLTITPR
jgi:organic hydroperoxide reductase OsmC/OhrA